MISADRVNYFNNITDCEEKLTNSGELFNSSNNIRSTSMIRTDNRTALYFTFLSLTRNYISSDDGIYIVDAIRRDKREDISTLSVTRSEVVNALRITMFQF